MSDFKKSIRGIKRITEIQDVIEWFTEQMKDKLIENIHRPGWKKESRGYLWDRLKEEVNELEDALFGIGKTNNVDKKEIIRECADVADLAMMIADVCKETK